MPPNKARACATHGCDNHTTVKLDARNKYSSNGSFCKACKKMRSRARKDGVNPDGMGRILLRQKYWFDKTLADIARE